jgi:hypothetical protein
MSSPGTPSRFWSVLGATLLFAGAWFVAVLVFSKGGPGAVTALGLLVMFAMLLFFLSSEAQDGRDMDRERITRNRKRRAWRLRRRATNRHREDPPPQA